ncbi:MAG TPA: hypothetical protein V6C57_14130 [Coleofasciculaceae cyanobacterium]
MQDVEVQQILDGWGEVTNSPDFSPEPQPNSTSIAIPQTQTIAPHSIQYLPQPQAQPAKPYWFRLAVVAIVSVSASGSLCFILWLLTAPNRMSGQAIELMGAQALIAANKPGNITISNQYECNQGLFGGQACQFPEPPVVSNGVQPVSVQGQSTSLQVSNKVERSLQELQSTPPTQLTLEELNKLKSNTPYETAIAHPDWWNAVNVAYVQRGGK